MEPVDAANDAVQFEAQAFGDGTTAGIFHRALNRDAVQIPSFETMIQHGAATRRHDALALMILIEPITQGGPTIGPVHIQVIDCAAKFSIKPDARVKAPVVRVLSLPDGYGALTIRVGVQQIHPPMPSPHKGTIGIEHAEKFPGVGLTNQTHLGASVNSATEHESKCKIKAA